jgi:hypothetical protein
LDFFVCFARRTKRNRDEKRRRDQFSQILRELEDLLYETDGKRRDKRCILKDSLNFLRNIPTQSDGHKHSIASGNHEILSDSSSLDDSCLAFSPSHLSDPELFSMLEDVRYSSAILTQE